MPTKPAPSSAENRAAPPIIPPVSPKPNLSLRFAGLVSVIGAIIGAFIGLCFVASPSDTNKSGIVSRGEYSVFYECASIGWIVGLIFGAIAFKITKTSPSFNRPHAVEVTDGIPCVSCRKKIAPDIALCPFCDWTQPKRNP